MMVNMALPNGLEVSRTHLEGKGTPTEGGFALVNRPAENSLPLGGGESRLRNGRSQRHRDVSALLLRRRREKSRLTPPNSNYTPKV